MQELDLKQLSKMLKESSEIEIKSQAKTIFDVSGFPHYENVLSNILAFFFDPTEEHRLKDLWIKSLLECYNAKSGKNLPLGSFEEVEREHPTEENKRIDIFILFDNAVVVIENKVGAQPYNPFDLYHNEAKKQAHGRIIAEILLSLRTEEDQEKQGNYSFINITYDRLIEQVKNNLGDYIIDANEKWLLFMKEVMNNIENLGARDTVNMNNEWQRFLGENMDFISPFFENYKKDIQSKILFIKNLEQRVRDRLNISDSQIGTYKANNSESYEGYFSLFIDIQKGEDTIVIEPFIERQNPRFLVIELWNRKKKNKYYDWSKELALLQMDFPEANTRKDGGWGNCLRLKSLDFADGIEMDDLVERIVSMYDKLTRDQR